MRSDNAVESRLEAGAMEESCLATVDCGVGPVQREWASGFPHLPPLILSVLITWFPLTEHGRQTWIAR